MARSHCTHFRAASHPAFAWLRKCRSHRKIELLHTQQLPATLAGILEATGSFPSAATTASRQPFCILYGGRLHYHVITAGRVNRKETHGAGVLCAVDGVGRFLHHGYNSYDTINRPNHPQYLQANARIMLRLRHESFLPNPFQFIGHFITRRYVVSIVTTP